MCHALSPFWFREFGRLTIGFFLWFLLRSQLLLWRIACRCMSGSQQGQQSELRTVMQSTQPLVMVEESVWLVCMWGWFMLHLGEALGGGAQNSFSRSRWSYRYSRWSIYHLDACLDDTVDAFPTQCRRQGASTVLLLESNAVIWCYWFSLHIMHVSLSLWLSSHLTTFLLCRIKLMRIDRTSTSWFAKTVR